MRPCGRFVGAIASASLARAVRAARDAAWMTAERGVGYAAILIAAYAAVYGWLLSAAPDTDFASFYAAGRLALSGHAAAAYSPVEHHAAERLVSGGRDVGYSYFFYPPSALLICALAALLPYWWAFAAWGGAQAALFAAALRSVGGRAKGSVLPFLAFPAGLHSLAMGQNALLTAALFAAGTSLLRAKRPFAAGLVLGSVTYKPQLGLLVPVALAAAGEWRALLGAAVGAAGLAAGAAAAFGPDVWWAWASAAAHADGGVYGAADGAAGAEGAYVPPLPGLFVSVYAAARWLGGGAPAALAAQAAATAGAAAAVWAAWRREGATPPKAAVLAAAAVLATPVVMFYDLALVAVAAAWIAEDARARGWHPWEKSALAACWAALFGGFAAAALTGAPLGPAVAAVPLLLAWRRGAAVTG